MCFWESSPRLHLFDEKYNKNSNIVKSFYNLKSLIYSRDGKAEFSASLLQSSMSHDPSEIILVC